MRKRFEPQTKLGLKPIEETPILIESRDDAPALLKALVEIYKTPEYSTQIFDILEAVILKGKHKTGRNGLSLWQIFVLAQFRLALNLDYDRLAYMVFSDSVLRQLLGIETETGFERIEIRYQRIIDNVSLLDEQTLHKINDVVVSFGHRQVFKKKETEALVVKTDSFVVESNVHFPTDYNLLWDSLRKSLDTIEWFCNQYPKLQGWRKLHDWFKNLKNLSRALGVASASGGKNKQERLENSTQQYLTKARALSDKLRQCKDELPTPNTKSLTKSEKLEEYIQLIDKHIDLVDRRILQGETIPHAEKLFSIFEPYTQWITKGKKHPSVELGKQVSITTDQYELIIDSYLMDNQTDSQIVIPTAERILKKYNVCRWSFDKGYWHIANKLFLKPVVEEVVMPKKGKPNKEEQLEQQTPEFKKARNQHSAVESNINELEHCGLDRCPDKGYDAFKRYVGIAIVAYNLKRIGRALLQQEKQKIKQQQKRRAKQAA